MATDRVYGRCACGWAVAYLPVLGHDVSKCVPETAPYDHIPEPRTATPAQYFEPPPPKPYIPPAPRKPRSRGPSTSKRARKTFREDSARWFQTTLRQVQELAFCIGDHTDIGDVQLHCKLPDEFDLEPISEWEFIPINPGPIGWKRK